MPDIDIDFVDREKALALSSILELVEKKMTN